MRLPRAATVPDQMYGSACGFLELAGYFIVLLGWDEAMTGSQDIHPGVKRAQLSISTEEDAWFLEAEKAEASVSDFIL